MPNAQQEWERELLGYAAQLDASHGAYLRQVLATGGPAAVMRELAGTGLSQGALEVAAATLDQRGFEGTVRHVQGRLHEAAQADQIAAVEAGITGMTPEQLAQAAQSPEMQNAAAAFLASRGEKLANGETAFDKVVSMYRPGEKPQPQPQKSPKPADDSARAHMEASWEKLVKDPRPRPPSDVEKHMRGQDLKPGTKAVVGDSWAHHLEQSARNLSGQSHDGIEAPPHLRAERMRTTAADLREKAHDGDSTRDHLSRSYERLEASQKGPDAVAQYDTTRSVTIEAARNLDSFAEREEADR